MAYDDGSVCECIVIHVQDDRLSGNAGGGWQCPNVHNMSVATEMPEGQAHM